MNPPSPKGTSVDGANKLKNANSRLSATGTYEFTNLRIYEFALKGHEKSFA
jgi:hypothetical protein